MSSLLVNPRASDREAKSVVADRDGRLTEYRIDEAPARRRSRYEGKTRAQIEADDRAVNRAAAAAAEIGMWGGPNDCR